MATFCKNNYFDNQDGDGGFVLQSYGKRHEKALGKARKSGAEGESLKLLKESGAIFSLHLITLAVSHHLTLTLAKLPQHLKVRSAWPLGSSKNTVIAEFLFHKSVITVLTAKVQKVSETNKAL